MGQPEQGTIGAKLTLVVILLAIPLIAFIAAIGIEWKLDSNLRKALLEQYPDKAAAIASISVSRLCTDPSIRSDKDFSDVCELSDNTALMKSGAVFAAVAGFALLGAIKIAGSIARRRRRLLLWLFAPGLHLTMLVLSGLMVLYAALGMAAIYFGESALIGRIHVGVMLALGMGAIFGVISLIRAQLGCVRKATTTALAKRLEPEQHKAIWNFVSELASCMGAQCPKTILAGLEPNFYVTEAQVLCLDGKLSGRTMYVSLPLCRILSVNELKAVLGHELAHYKGLDTRFSEKFYPIYRGATQGLLNIASGVSEKGGASGVVLLPAFTILAYFLNCFCESEREITRERELAADSEAASVGSARHLASALVKVHGFSAVWHAVRQGMKDALEHGKALINASAFFAMIVNELDRGEALTNVSEEGPVHPTDTHPLLTERLKNVHLSLEDVLEEASRTSPDVSASSLFENTESLEAELTDAEQARMVRTGEVTPAASAAAS